MELVELRLKENNIGSAIVECLNTNQVYLAKYLSNFFREPLPTPIEMIKVKLLCNWCTSEELTKCWNKMSKGNYTWNNIVLVTSDKADYYVIINQPPEGAFYEKDKTIIFQMEPHMKRNLGWKEWCDPSESEFFRVCKHVNEYNNNEWHISLTYQQLCDIVIVKNPEYDNILSTILSAAYRDPGHVKRVDFIKFVEKELVVHVYGNNKWDYKHYKRSLPYHCKDEGLLPYKYTFNAENHEIKNYYTEKLIDGILSECVTFYWGCPNIRELINPKAYVQLGLSNFAADLNIIKTAMQEDWHSKMLPYIKEEKKRILNELQFFPRLEKIISLRKS